MQFGNRLGSVWARPTWLGDRVQPLQCTGQRTVHCSVNYTLNYFTMEYSKVAEMRVLIPKSLDHSDPSSFLGLDLGLDIGIGIFKALISILFKGLAFSKS